MTAAVKNDNNNQGRAVVTGASSGIGAAYADFFAGLGYDLLLIARRRNLLEEKATFLADNHHIVAEAFTADLSNLEDIQRVEEKLKAIPDITMLVNNIKRNITNGN